MRQKRFEPVQQFRNRLLKDDLFVSLTIYDVPASLLKEFSATIIKPYYPSGVSEAIKDLMRKAILEQQLASNVS